MTGAAGLALMKLPSLGSDAFDHQLSIGNLAGATPADRRRASITDPSLHAHSSSSLNSSSPSPNPPPAQDQLASRSRTLPSFREFSRHSKNSPFVGHTHKTTTTPNTLQPPAHSLDHVSADPAATRRRGSAADLEHILLSNNNHSAFARPLVNQPSADHVVSPTSRLSLSEQQTHHPSLGHPSQPYNLNSFSFESSLPSVHLSSHPSITPISPRSFSSVPLSNNPSDPNLLPAAPTLSRRPTPLRRRSSRAHELDVTQSEDPARSILSGPSAGPNGSDHLRAIQPPPGSQWPYPTPHLRHHLQRPSGPVKRRGSSQSITDSTAPPSNCYGVPPDQPSGSVDRPWNGYRPVSNNSYRDPAGDSPSVLRNYRLDARRQSEASSVSSTGLSYDRRQSGESAECDGPDDHRHLPPIHSLRRRSWSSSSKQSVPPFSPNQTAVAPYMCDYELPPLPYKEQTSLSPSFANPAPGEHVMLADNSGWYNSLDDQTVVRCASGVDDVYDLKDKLAATRLLYRLPPHSHPAPEQAAAPCGSTVGQTNPQDKPCNPYSRSPELKISHKLAERKRRKEMRNLFDELMDVLPPVDERHSKGSKWETLSRAVDYMQQLKLENDKLRRENLELQSQVEPN